MTESRVRAIRGATTVPANTREDIVSATHELMTELMQRNALVVDDVISVLFTTTPDLNAAFPATAARSAGFGSTPLMCAREIDVPGAKPLVIRVMMHVYTSRSRDEIDHVYLHDAVTLRNDVER